VSGQNEPEIVTVILNERRCLRDAGCRGIDGPGMHILDCAPEAYAKLPGGPEAIAARQALVAKMLERPPKIMSARMKKERKVAQAPAAQEEGETPHLERDSTLSSSMGSVMLDWVQYDKNYSPPVEQEMTRRYGPSAKLVPTLSRASSF
jgi:hypothetical protein